MIGFSLGRVDLCSQVDAKSRCFLAQAAQSKKGLYGWTLTELTLRTVLTFSESSLMVKGF